MSHPASLSPKAPTMASGRIYWGPVVVTTVVASALVVGAMLVALLSPIGEPAVASSQTAAQMAPPPKPLPIDPPAPVTYGKGRVTPPGAPKARSAAIPVALGKPQGGSTLARVTSKGRRRQAKVALPALAKMAPKGVMLAAGPAQAPAPEEGEACATFGTKIAFTENPLAAKKKATDNLKLLFVLHVSGNFEKEEFT